MHHNPHPPTPASPSQPTSPSSVPPFCTLYCQYRYQQGKGRQASTRPCPSPRVPSSRPIHSSTLHQPTRQNETGTVETARREKHAPLQRAKKDFPSPSHWIPFSHPPTPHWKFDRPNSTWSVRILICSMRLLQIPTKLRCGNAGSIGSIGTALPVWK